MTSFRRTVASATLLCGTLDIAYAIGTSMLKGGSGMSVLKIVAQGLFGNAVPASTIGVSVLGLGVHFGIMALMVTIYVMTMRSSRLSTISPWLSGVVYGLLLYAVMYWIVLPLRWPQIFPQTGLMSIAEALFAHIVLVGLPLAHIAHKALPGQASVRA